MGSHTFYAEVGINWWFVYQVEYEDDLIVVLRDCGRVHKRDAGLLKPIAAWIELRSNGFADINGKRKLYETR